MSTTLKDVLLRRKQLRQKRRLIHNDDGAAAGWYHHTAGIPVTVDNFLNFQFALYEGRPTPDVPNNVKSDFTSIAFNVLNSGLGHVVLKTPGYFIGSDVNPDIHYTPEYLSNEIAKNTAAGQPNKVVPLDITKHFYEYNGIDVLEATGNYFADKEMEVFAGVRVNDRHDATFKREKLNPLKRKLWDSGGLLQNGVNNALDFENPAARAVMTDAIIEIITSDRYILDGIYLDFNRHLGLFKNHLANPPEAYRRPLQQYQLDIVTNWIRHINNVLNLRNIELMDQGREPMILLICVPNNSEYCKLCGLDVDLWMKEGIVDVLIPNGYQDTDFIQNYVSWGRSYGVSVCPSVIDVRLDNSGANSRIAAAGFAGRIHQFLSAADGLNFFNFNYSYKSGWRHPGGAESVYRHLTTDKVINWVSDGVFKSSRRYYNAWTHQNPSNPGTAAVLPEGVRFSYKYPKLTSETPLVNSSGIYFIEIFEDKEKVDSATVTVVSRSTLAPYVEVNGVSVTLTLTSSANNYWTGTFDPNLLRKGKNEFKVTKSSDEDLITDIWVDLY